MKVQLYHCLNCGLEWKPNGEKRCPKCLRFNAVNRVVLAGRSVEVEFKVWGKSQNDSATRGLESLDLGSRCEHGLIHMSLCGVCNQ